MIRGEKPIELGDSWFSAKSIEVERIFFMYILEIKIYNNAFIKGVEHSLGEGGPKPYRPQRNSEYLYSKYTGRL